MVQLQIRGVTKYDIDCVAAIEAECFPKAEAAPRQALAARIHAYPEYFLVAEAKGKLIGFVNGCATDSPVIYDELYSHIELHRPNGKYLAVFGLDVVPAWRRQGVAAALLHGFITLAKAKGRQGVILTCKNRLTHYYETFGFVNQGVSQSTHGGAEWFDMTLALGKINLQKGIGGKCMLRIGEKRIEIKKGDITDETSDAIINPANSALLHGGGAARDIAMKGGPVIDRQSREIIRRIGFLPVGKAVMTEAGELPAKFVIHTVGPQWGEGNEHAKLEKAVLSCLTLAELYHLKTVSMPAISSGVFGFPKPDCARILLTTCLNFLQGHVDLEKVIMCNFDEETYQIFLTQASLLEENACQF